MNFYTYSFRNKEFQKILDFANQNSILSGKTSFDEKHVLEGCALSDASRNLHAVAVIFSNPYHVIEEKKYLSIGCIYSKTPEGLIELLDRIKGRYERKDFAGIIGPLNGSTWDSYRFSIDGESAPFFLEPFQDAFYPACFESQGYETLYNYKSHITRNIQGQEFINPYQHIPEEKGITIREVNMEDWDKELEAIAEISLEAFKDAALYSPITKEEFISRMAGLKKIIEKEFFLIAEYESKVIAYFFGYRDLLYKSQTRLVAKTLARNPDPRWKGIGAFLTFELIKRAKAAGMDEAVHALFQVTNASKFISDKHNQEHFRSYKVFRLKF